MLNTLHTNHQFIKSDIKKVILKEHIYKKKV